jgi:hypothetical protein
MTMNTTKTMMLAALTPMTLGVGTAMADGPDVTNDHQPEKVLAARQAQLGQVQSGMSDLSSTGGAFQLGPFHATPYRPNGLVGYGGGN